MESSSAVRNNENANHNGNKIRKISLFVNGVVSLGIYHTIIVVDYGESVKIGRFRLLEVDQNIENGIKIHDAKADTQSQALNQRRRIEHEVEMWSEDANINAYDSTIKSVIDEYTGKEFVPFSPYGAPRNCRTFANSVLKACGSSKRTYGYFRNIFIE